MRGLDAVLDPEALAREVCVIDRFARAEVGGTVRGHRRRNWREAKGAVPAGAPSRAY
jgi:hypothetical protein